jgi:peroxiredoxin
MIVFSQNEQLAQNETNIQKGLDNLHVNTLKVNDSIGLLMKECDNQIKIENDSLSKNKLELRLSDLWNIKDQNTIAELQLELEFAKKNPSSLKCLQLINMRMHRFEGMNFYDSFYDIYQNLSPEIKKSEEGKKMAEGLNYFKQSKVGSVAPEFKVKDIDGKQLSLKDYIEKKYVLIDFWASWCAPCREELTYIKQLYELYDEEGLEIISITKDENLESWKKAILKEKIDSWRHFSIVENNDSILKDYYVFGIPHKILIDKNGMIIGKWKGGGEKNKQDLQLLLREVFEKK